MHRNGKTPHVREKPAKREQVVGARRQHRERVEIETHDVFENRTTRPEIEQRVTEEVASRISRRPNASSGPDQIEPAIPPGPTLSLIPAC